MKKFRVYVVLACIVFAWSCARIPYNIPTRDISYTNKPYTKNLALYGYVLLNNPGNDISLQEKNRSFARSYLKILPASSELRNVNPSNLLVTYWMVTVPSQHPVDNLTSLLQFYDYARATRMFAAINKLDRTGPFLVAWKNAFEKLDKDSLKHYLYLDLSNYDSADMNRAILLWRKMMANPDADIENAVLRFREDMRDLIQKYGGSLVDLVTKSKT